MENTLENLSKNYDKGSVSIYVSYLKQLGLEKDKEGKLKNYWFSKLTEQNFIDVFIKVHSKTGMYIDGDSITLNFRGKLLVTYDYHAFVNRVLISYPETIFDYQIVYEEDEFSFEKVNGKVIYKHKIGNPFANKKKIIGAYAVIKNRKGEFVEMINTETITKMRNSSTMKSIWEIWEDRMVLKSVIKRICSSHFHDITQEISSMDNEESEPALANLDDDIQTKIENAKSLKELTEIYKENVKLVKDVNAFTLLCSTKRKLIEKK